MVPYCCQVQSKLQSQFLGPLCLWQCLSDPGKPGVQSLGPDSGCPSLSETPCVDLTDMTLADEDTNSIQTDDANKAIQGNVAMQVAPPGGQICN